MRALAPFPHLTSKREWKLTRGREAADVNLEVREAVDRDGHSLVKIALSLSEIPKQWRNKPFRSALSSRTRIEEETMGRGILLWLLGVPIPVIILLWLFFGR